MSRWLLLASALLVAGCTTEALKGRPSDWIGPRADPEAAERSRRIDEVSRLIDDGLDGKALELIIDLERQHVDHPGLHLQRARIHARAEAWTEAVAACQRALAGSSSWIEPRVLLAQCLIKLERLVEAEAVFGDLDRLAPELPWGAYGQAWAAIRRGDAARSTVQAERALAIDRDHLPSLLLLAGLVRVAGDATREELLLTRAVRQRALTGEAAAESWARLGALAADSGRLTDARRAFGTSYRLQPRPETARALRDLAAKAGDRGDEEYWRNLAGSTPALTPPPPR